eukprot:CAMPEP_0172313580 /NCGR_PEP_ID=MMETSP1058-20130122/20508_1 /TAXON_ID=83371 /ORGANISM="Detonula confervacea, Strain CCMP 353" /LENGTH=180 /DNA_ID=CAMNT_0013027255 /DNA_START=1 /DNA_END=540 /DNA_ORIENTATION=-
MDASQPDWVSSAATSRMVEDEECKPVLADRATVFSAESFAPSMSASGGMEMSTSDSPQLAHSSQRTFLHRVYRFFKFITISISLLLFIAQVVSVIFLPFDGVELVLKLFLSTFSVLIILNELEWWVTSSPLLQNWIPRGYFYAFIGMVSLEENNIKSSSSSLNALPVDYTAAIFIETASW